MSSKKKEIVYSALEREFYDFLKTDKTKELYMKLCEDLIDKDDNYSDIDFLKLVFLRDYIETEDLYYIEYGYCCNYKYYVKKVFDRVEKEYIYFRFSDDSINNLIIDYENNYEDEERKGFKDYVFKEIEIVEKVTITKEEWREI